MQSHKQPRARWRCCSRWLAPAFASCSLLLSGSTACAQQTTVTSPVTRAGHGYSEYMGVQWGVNFPGGFFRFGGPPPASAPQGLARFGTGFQSGNTNGYFNFYAGQSSQTNLNSGASSVTLGNGQSGGIFEGRQVPFVLGVVPVVGGFAGNGFSGGMPQPPVPYAPRSALEDRLERLRANGVDLTAPPANSHPEASVTRENGPPGAATAIPRGESIPLPQGSVEAIAAQRAQAEAVGRAELEQEIRQLVSRANQAAAEGKQGAARIYLQMALRRVDPSQRAAIEARLKELTPHQAQDR